MSAPDVVTVEGVQYTRGPVVKLGDLDVGDLWLGVNNGKPYRVVTTGAPSGLSAFDVNESKPSAPWEYHLNGVKLVPVTPTVVYETLRPDTGMLVTNDYQVQVRAKTLAVNGERYVVLRTWMGGACHHHVLNGRGVVVAEGRGGGERASWALCEKMLKQRGIL